VRSGVHRLKWILVLEALLAGVYVSLTRGLFLIFLVSIGYAVEGISFVVLIASLSSLAIAGFLYKHPGFLTHRVKLKLLAFHAFERITWFFMPLVQQSLMISFFYSLYMAFSSVLGVFLSFTIYGSLSEKDIRDVTAKRAAAMGISNIAGYALGVFLLAFIPYQNKFIAIFSLGSVIGLFSTALIAFLDVSNLENAKFPEKVEQPEKVFSTSFFFVTLLLSGNLFGIVWTPYVMNELKGTDFIAASLSLSGTLASIVASLVWREKSFKTLRIGLAFNALGPLLAWLVPYPEAHIGISVFTSFTFTAANFMGTFLFARYNEWFGAVKSSILMVIIGNLAQLVSAPLGLLVGSNYTLAFPCVFATKVAATALAVGFIPEVAVVREDVARTYSRILYRNSLIGYRIVVEVSRETVLATFRLLALSMVLAALYLIYRVLWWLIS